MISIFVASIIFAIWCILLFFQKSIGLSMLLFIAPFTYYLIHKLEKYEKIVNKKAKMLMIPIILLASTYFIYNNKFFNTINIFVIILLIGYMIYRLFNDDIRYNFNLVKQTLGVFFKPLGFIEKTFDKLTESFEDRKRAKNKTNNNEKMRRIAKAIAITFPIVLIIIVLLASADEVFGKIFFDIEQALWKMIIQLKFSEVIARILLAGLICIYLLIFFSYIFNKYKKQEIKLKNEMKQKDNFTIRVILGTLNIVYLIFCIIQIKSLFMRNVDINYADYARRGFFQLMLVSLINLITILIAKKSENHNEKRKNIYINLMSITMIIFTLIILISAAIRMYFYESAYGYTLLRLLVYCALFTESVLLLPTIAYILNIKICLPKVYFGVIVTVYICMNFANFDAIIAKRNVDRFTKTGKIDVEYLTKKTGTDALEEIVRLMKMENLNILDKRDLNRYMEKLDKEFEKEKMDFRDFNLSRAHARSLIYSVDIERTIDSKRI